MKNRLITVLIFVIILLCISAFVIAKPNLSKVSVINSHSGVQVTIPANAVEVSKNVFSLGKAVDVNGKVVEGYMIIHKKEEKARPVWAADNSKKRTSKCYAFLFGGIKWRTIEPYIVDTSNDDGLNDSVIRNILASSIAKWEDATDGKIDGQGKDIIGDEIPGVTDGPNIGALNGMNEIIFADIADPNTIAVTLLWGVFSGTINQREIVEWDQIYDDVTFDWSTSGEARKIDFENVATHELGHSIGLGHPESTCIEETMYAYVNLGETKKRSLNTGDITGANRLY